MSIIKSEDKKKWINSFVVICSAISGFVIYRFAGAMAEQFDLEAKVSNFFALQNAAALATAIIVFFAIIKNEKASTHMSEVYDELVKVVWPEKDAVLKITVGLIIALSIVSSIFVLIDVAFRELLNLIY